MISLFPSNIIGGRRQTRHGGMRLYGIGHTRRQRIPIPHIWNFPLSIGWTMAPAVTSKAISSA
jgi:hypothetical protein